MKLVRQNETPFLLIFSIPILPFFILYWMLPFVSKITLGWDYQLFSINEQIELLFSIKTGSFPLYVPGYAFGHSSSALTLSQIYHPISHVSSLLPGYWDGKALEWNTFIRLLSLGITQLILFVFLRKLRLNTIFSFIISFITVYNLRMLEAFRYGASLEAYTGYLMLCAVIGCYFISPSRWFGPLSIIGLTYLLVCSGHPPMMFYGLVGTGLFIFIVPFYLSSMLPVINTNLKNAFKFWTKVVSYVCIGVLLSSIYILPFYFDFVKTNAEYAHSPYQSDMGQDTFIGTLNNFFMPFISSILSTFGGSSLFLIPIFLPLLRFSKFKIPWSIWGIWGILLFIFLYLQGPRMPVHRLIWEYIPFVSSTGSVGRISLIAPLFIGLLIAWLVKTETVTVKFKRLPIITTPFSFLAFIALVTTPLYLSLVYLLKPQFGPFTPHFVRNIPFGIELISVLLGMFSLSIVMVYHMRSSLTPVKGVLLCLIILLQLAVILKFGVSVEKKINKPTFEQLIEYKKKELSFPFRQNPGMNHDVGLTQINHSFIEPFLGKIFTDVIPVDAQEDAYKIMRMSRLPQQIFIEGYDVGRAKRLTEGAKEMKKGEVRLIYSSFNRLEFKVYSESPAIFGLSYPYTGNWRAWVNGERVKIYRANGAAHGVEIPAGESIVEFRYWSNAFFGGMIISCVTLAGIGLVICLRGLRGFPRVIGITFVLIIGVSIFILWYNSLYSGDNLETEYVWIYEPPLNNPNLAYGKKTLGYYPASEAQLRFHGSKAVDGDKRLGSGFILRPTNEPLIVDLNQSQIIKTIILYGNFSKEIPEISISNDGEDWQKIFVEKIDNPIRIIFEKSQTTRYIKVKTSTFEVGIDELEVYGPGEIL